MGIYIFMVSSTMNILLYTISNLQVALEKNESLFLTDPTKVPGLEQNDLMLTYGYSYYAGTPWTVGQNRG